MVMKTTMVNINQAKTHLSKYARMVKRGERIVLCDRNRPFAEIRPLATDAQGKRPFGLLRGKIEVGDDFNQPDPQLEALFYSGTR